MISVTRLNHTALVLNADLIELIEVTPDTVISLTTGEKLVVLESAAEVVRRVVEYRQAVFRMVLHCPCIQAPDQSEAADPAASAGTNPTDSHDKKDPD